MNEKKTRVILNIVSELLGKGIVLIISIIIPKLYIDYFGSEYNGLMTSLNGIFVYLNLLEAGIGSASIQALYKPIVNNDPDRISHIISATKRNYFHNGIYFLCCLSVVAFLYPHFSHTDIQYAIVVALVFISAAPYILKFFFRGKFTVLLTADNRLYIINLVSQIFHVLANVVKIIMLRQRMNIILIQAVFGITSMLEVIVFSLYVKKKYKTIDFNAEPDFTAISKSRSAMIHELAYVIFSNVDVVLLTYFCGLKTVSVYSVYNLIFLNLNQLLQSFTNGTNASLGQLMFQNKQNYIKSYYNFEFLFQCISCIVIVSAGAVTREFVSLYTIHAKDTNYLINGMTSLFVSIQILSLIRWPGVGAIKAAGLFKETQGRAIVEMLINLVLSIGLVFKYGMHGVLVATVVALLYRTTDVILFTEKRILSNSKGRRPIRIALLVIVSAIAYMVEYRFGFSATTYFQFGLHGLLFFFINCLIFGGFYFATRRLVR